MATNWRNKIKKTKTSEDVNDVSVQDAEVIETDEVSEHVKQIHKPVKEKKEWNFSFKIGTFLIGMVSILFLLFCGSEVYSNYDAVDQTKESYSWADYFDSWEFEQKLQRVSYGLYFDRLATNMGYTQTLNSLFSAINDDTTAWDMVTGFYYEAQEDPNLQYYIVHEPTNSETYSGKQLEVLNDGINEEELDTLMSQYQYLVQYSYDDQGQVTMNYIWGADKDHLLEHLNTPNLTQSINYSSSPLAPIKDTTITVAVPKELAPYGFIYTDIMNSTTLAYSYAIMPYIVTFTVLITLFVLLVPYRLVSKIALLKAIDRIPYEFIGVGAIFSLVFFTLEIAPNLIFMTRTHDLLRIITEVFPTWDGEFLVSLVNIGTWSVAFGIGFILIYTIKGLFVNGIWYSLKHRLLILIILRWIKKWMVKGFNSFKDIRLGQPLRKKLTIAVGINFIVVSLLCATWFFGIIGVFFYSVFLFWFVSKMLKKFQKDYDKVRHTVSALADGVLDATVADDFGYFEDLKHDMQTLQVGFKKAVQEEVKSTRMKSELITNVSHDLKTPLTAIITYVDLLKDPNLEEEKRAQYLETLDRKTDRLKVLIEDLFEMSKVSSGTMSINLADVDVVSLMKQALFEAEDKFAERNIMVKSYLPEHKVMLQLDSERMYRVLENLIFNISKYAMPMTRAYVEVQDFEDEVQIIFKNMSAEEITFSVDEIVERFVRGDQARHTEGSGLGLAIAKSFVELQGGVFEVIVDGDLFKVVITFKK
ncbi:MAG TPA: hypothetical protein DCY20_07585 [Firmicutes bacterium]|nr:hypothetical protein [Bacillota bacterium]